MSTMEQLQAVVGHLTEALDILDQLGAHVTAAHVDQAIHALTAEARTLSWDDIETVDFAALDAIVNDYFATQGTKVAA